MDWVSLGGGIAFTAADYPVDELCSVLRQLSDRFGVPFGLVGAEFMRAEAERPEDAALMGMLMESGRRIEGYLTTGTPARRTW